MKYSYNNKQNISFQDHYEQNPPKVKYSLPGPQHPLKVKYFPETVPKIVTRCIGDTAYDSYIAETLYPLKSAIKPSEQCQDHTCKEDQITPSQIDHQSRRPGLADTNRVVTSQGRK